MGFKENYQEYKQRQEAKAFFNANNNYYLTPKDYIKCLGAGLVASILVTFLITVIENRIGIGFSVTKLIAGYCTGFAVYKVHPYGSNKTGVIAVVSYILGSVLALLFASTILLGVPLNLSPMYLLVCAYGMFSNIFGLIYTIIACILAYRVANN